MTRRALFGLDSVLVIRLAAAGLVAAQEIAVRPSLAIADVAVTPGGWTLPPAQLGSTIVELMIGELVPSQRGQVDDVVAASPGSTPNTRRNALDQFMDW